MFKKQFNQKTEPVCWKHFSRRGDAIFRSLHKEIRIGVLSVATLSAAAPAQAENVLSVVPAVGTEAWADSLVATSAELGDVEVVGTLVPIAPEKAVRMVQVLSRKEIEASSAQSVNDLLKLVAGVDVRQRGAWGIQTDIGINGGNHDQLTVLLNGINISNPHTGHLTFDLPVSMDDIERIEVLEGGASRVYGSQAFSGVINIVTVQHAPYADSDDKGARRQVVGGGATAEVGSFSTTTLGARVFMPPIKGTGAGKFSTYLTGGYANSEGGTSNSDYVKGNAYWNGAFTSRDFDIKLQAGFSTMDYGANTFYGTGSKTQYEENSRYIVSAQGEYKGRPSGKHWKGIHVLPQLYWTRSMDHYVWTRSNPAAYQNFHQTNVYGASVNAYTEWLLGKTALGFEFRQENILSTRLGKEIPEDKPVRVPGETELYYKYKDGRSNYNIYLEHNVLLKYVSISAGLLANYNTAVLGGMKFYPGADISWRPNRALKVYASFNQSLRTPTFTDLYYYGPGIQGNVELKPEKSTNYAIGINWTHPVVQLQAKGFYRKGTDMIDWVKYKDATIYTKANSDIDTWGAEALAAFNFRNLWGAKSYLQDINLSYCWIDQYRVNTEQASQYQNDLNYLKHKFVATLSHRIVSRLSLQWEFVLKQRMGAFDNVLTGQPESYGTNATLDAKLVWTTPEWGNKKGATVYVKFSNITDNRYYDYDNVPQPGFWLMGGIKVAL